MVSLFQRARMCFDDEGLVANAGLGVVDQYLGVLGFGGIVDSRVWVGSRPSRKIASVVSAMLLGGTGFDDVDVLRAGGTSRVLQFRPMASSTVGEFFRDFDHGNVRQLESAFGEVMERAWRAGAGPGSDRLLLDIDSSVVEVYGNKQGAAWSYNDKWALHPVFVSRGDTGEVVTARLRKGNAHTAQGCPSLLIEAFKRVRRGGAIGEIILRADSGFYSKKIMDACRSQQVRFSITAPDNALIRDYVSHIPKKAWKTVPYRGGIAQVAETTWRHPTSKARIIVRRVKNWNAQKNQQVLFDEWKYLAFVTDRLGDPIMLDREHRQRSTQETLVIRELKENAVKRLPSNDFNANHAWLLCACMAHNISRQLHVLTDIKDPVGVLKSFRRKILTIPARITKSARQYTLHFPTNWPWREMLIRITQRLRWITHPT